MKRDESGTSLVEYALLVTFIAVACIFALGVLGSVMRAKFQEQACSINGQTYNSATHQCEGG